MLDHCVAVVYIIDMNSNHRVKLLEEFGAAWADDS